MLTFTLLGTGTGEVNPLSAGGASNALNLDAKSSSGPDRMTDFSDVI